MSHAGGDLAGIASYALEHSRDGVTYTPLVAAQATPVQARESASAQDRWWYRGTVCDANHNCASVVKGPTGTGSSASLLSRPALRKLVGHAPGTLSRAGARLPAHLLRRDRVGSRSTWTVIVKQAGGKRILARRSARVRADARVTRMLNLPPKIACGRSLTVTIRVRGSSGATQTVRHLPRGSRLPHPLLTAPAREA